MQLILLQRPNHYVLLLSLLLTLLSSCYTYRLQTHAQAGTEVTTVNASSYFWGLLQKPKGGITTSLCDSLDVNGVSVEGLEQILVMH